MKIVYSLIFTFLLAFLYYKIDYAIYPILLISNKVEQACKSAYSNKTIDEYRLENESIKSELVELQSKINFIENTQELVDFSYTYKRDKKIAKIIIKNLDEFSNFYILDIGDNSGINVDMPIVYKNFLLGKIVEVHKYWSKAILITDKACKIAAACTKSNVKSIHEGQNNIKTSSLNFVDHLDKVVIGDLIISSGEGLIFPKGFGLGTIQSAEVDGLSYNVVVKPLVDFSSIDYCYILM